jgi:transposase
MEDATTLLFARPGYRVLDVSAEADGGRRLLVETCSWDAACPDCGVFSAAVHERPVRRVKDLPHGSVPLRVWVRKRRYRCLESACLRRSFTESTGQVPARSRLTLRLRERVSAAVTATNRAVSEVALEHDIAWGTVHRILVAAAAQRLGLAAATTRIGIDETRARSVRCARCRRRGAAVAALRPVDEVDRRSRSRSCGRLPRSRAGPLRRLR